MGQAYLVYSSLRQVGRGEVVCVDASLVALVVEEAVFAAPVREDVTCVWDELECSGYVKECGSEVKAGIEALALPSWVDRKPPYDLSHPELVVVIELMCPVAEVFQCLLGSKAPLGHRHRASSHDAVLAAWRHRYGAHVVCVGDDTLMLDVARPPSTQREIREVMWQHHVYCDGEQGVDLGGKARYLTQLAKQWAFWWDLKPVLRPRLVAAIGRET